MIFIENETKRQTTSIPEDAWKIRNVEIARNIYLEQVAKERKINVDKIIAWFYVSQKH